jgi:hypothetical protein
MRRIFIIIARTINQFAAFAVVALGAAVGYHWPGAPDPQFYAVLGGMMGAIIAAVMFGLIAAVFEIERHLAHMEKLMENRKIA